MSCLFLWSAGIQQKGTAKAGSYTNYFADALIAEAERDSRIVAVHAAMAGGTGEQVGLVQRWENSACTAQLAVVGGTAASSCCCSLSCLL